MKTKKTTEKKTELKPPRQQGDLSRDKIRAGMLRDPGSNAEVLTRENTKDLMREHYEAEATRYIPAHGITDEAERKRILEAWNTERIKRKQEFETWIKGGGPAPDKMLFDALLCVWDYPPALGNIGLHYPFYRELPTLQKAFANIEAHFNHAANVLTWATRFADMDTAPLKNGTKALREVYMPNPDGFGTTSGVSYPNTDAKPWPACMSPTDWNKLHDPTKSDLIRLRDALIRLNHSTGKKSKTRKNQQAKNQADLAKVISAVLTKQLKPHAEGLKKSAIINAPPDQRTCTDNLKIAFDRQTQCENKINKWTAVACIVVDDAEVQLKKPLRERQSLLLTSAQLNNLIKKLQSSEYPHETIIHDLAANFDRSMRRRDQAPKKKKQKR